MKVALVDLKAQYQEIKTGVEPDIKKLMKRGDFILGQDVRRFEEAFARYVGSTYCLGVNSGTDALFFSLLSLGVGPRDEVLVPVFTYIASAFAVTYTGAKPVFVDIDEKTFNIDPNKIEAAITKKTKAIMPVHLYGQAADMRAIKKIADKHGLKIVEDAAQAHGAEACGKKAGVLGDVAAFSFYPTKNLSAFGDAGVVTTNDNALFERLKKLRDYGRKTRYEHSSLGYNSRLDSLQAIFLYHKLKRLDIWNKKRAAIAARYTKLLKDVSGIKLSEAPFFGKHVWHVYAIRVKNRDSVLEGLKSCGIDAMVYYPVPLHLQEVYKSLNYTLGDFPIAEKISSEVLCLPIHPHMTMAQVDFVVEKLKRINKNALA
jgi:dTDP-4-amino-4,6-dideoxygalactose transaminase